MKNSLKMLLLMSVFVLTACKQEALLSGLDQVQANEVVALLMQNNIDATKHNEPKAGFSVMVDSRDFPTAVDLITQHNLPSKQQIEVSEMFPADSLVSSPRAEMARMYSAIEQRLEKTLSQIDGVVSARVHVSYDAGNGNSREEVKPVHLSALLRTDSNNLDRSALISDAKRLLKNSFANVDYDNVSVVISKMPEINQLRATKPTDAVSDNNFFVYGGILFVVLIFLSALIFSMCLKFKSRKKRNE